MKRLGRHETFFPTVTAANWGGRVTRAEINLDAIASNIASLQHHVGRIEVMAVVKGDGYGHGAVQVSKTALSSGATRLGVYTVDEAIELRRAGIKAPILVFGPVEAGEGRDVWNYGLTPTITSLETAEMLQRASTGGTLPFHLKLDTGMTRAGVSTQDAIPLMRALDRYPGLRPEGIFTHFACADEDDKTSCRNQLRVFHEVVKSLAAEGQTFTIRHTANSAATISFPDGWLDMVRVGISCYGYFPSTAMERRIALHPALTLHSSIIRVTRISSGQGVGYGHQFRADGERLIGLIPIGYGDGLPRVLGCGNGAVLLGGTRVPVVGRVSMDQITVDVSGVAAVAQGDPVVVIGSQAGEEQTADDLAERTGTLSYEILTGLLPRVPRIYTRRGQVVGIVRRGQYTAVDEFPSLCET